MTATGQTIYHDRVRRAQAEMARQGVDALAIGVGSDLDYLTGYPSHNSERLTLLIVPKEGEPRIVVPELEAPRLKQAGVPFAPVVWSETEDPANMAADLIWETGARSVASGDHLWATTPAGGDVEYRRRHYARIADVQGRAGNRAAARGVASHR